MKQARFSKRFSRRLRGQAGLHKRGSGINLVSLMDIFTILVFFLLVNSAEVQTLSSNASLKLPESVSEDKPRDNLVIQVNRETLVVQGREIARIAEIDINSDLVIAELKTELKYQADRLLPKDAAQNVTGDVTIMGDREISYRLLKRIMLTCADANFGNISLAVQQKAKGPG